MSAVATKKPKLRAESLDEVLTQHRIVVCLGTGGVGKTTIAAALGVEAAARGLNTLVLTIDPARRLADALGVSNLTNEPCEVPNTKQGKLFAMMLDTKHTFDGLIERFAENEALRDQILENPIYQHVSNALAGSGEYAAMEKVLEVSETGDFDLILVDTPPATHALDFLDAPMRMKEFFDSRLVHLLVHPAMAAGRMGFRLMQRPMQAVLQMMEKVTGFDFLADLAGFLTAVEGLSGGFVERAERIQNELLDESTAFVLVSGPSRQTLLNTGLFLDHLKGYEIAPAALILNRMHLWPGGGDVPDCLQASNDAQALEPALSALAAGLAGDGAASDDDRLAAQKSFEAASEYAATVQLDLDNTAALRDAVARLGSVVHCVPELQGDVHDLQGLERVADTVFRGGRLTGSE
jgi:anion-transporting  ArsA/GET3 family ATPase